MDTNPQVDWKALAAPFPADSVEWRLQQSGEKSGRIWGMALAYVTNRAIMQRLDDVVGPANWRNEFKPTPLGDGVLCGLSIRVPRADGTFEWVTKWDGADNTDIEAVRGGLSGAMKRAAVQWGIGRYLYQLGESWIQPDERGQYSGKTKQGTFFKWNAPKLPDWALPKEVAHEEQRGAPARGEQADPGEDGDELASLIAYMRSYGPQIPEAAVFKHKRKERNLREFISENWEEIKTTLPLAREVVKAIEDVVGKAYSSTP